MAIAAIETSCRIRSGSSWEISDPRQVTRAVVEKSERIWVPIRIGVNSGSLETAAGKIRRRDCRGDRGERPLDKVHMIGSMGYDNLVVSIKIVGCP